MRISRLLIHAAVAIGGVVAGLVFAAVFWRVVPLYHPLTIGGSQQSGLLMYQWILPAAMGVAMLACWGLIRRSGIPRTKQVYFALLFLYAFAAGLVSAVSTVYNLS